jgi:hypothetical protein
LWGLIRAMLPLIRDGLVRVLAADPKLMELAYGRIIFDTYGAYAADPVAIVAMLEAAVADMQARAAMFAGHQAPDLGRGGGMTGPALWLTDDCCPACGCLLRQWTQAAASTTEDQKWWITLRAEAQQHRDQAAEAGADTADFDELITDLDDQITNAGIRGKAAPAKPKRRHRSTRRRPDAPDLPKRKISPSTIGKTYTAPDGKTFRPSLFVTLTCPSYGRVGQDGTPADPQTYNYDHAARDALTFAALFDRFIQNLRRYLGYDLQYFAAIEPQKRLAPHVHIAMRGTVARAEIRRVLAATYHQVWWPSTSTVKYDDGELPVWDEHSGNYVDSATGEVLPSWDQALDELGDQPHHVARFGARFDAQGVLAGSKDAARCIGYLTKYLNKQAGDCHHAENDAQRAHAARLAEALRYQPCSPTCANWLRYGIQPKNARPGLVPGRCKGKAHDADHLGYAGRRVLVSRKWSGKTLADHRADRQQWLLSTLGISATDPARYRWELVAPGDPDHMDHARRLLHAVADRARWQAALNEARRRAAVPPDGDLSAAGKAA